MTYNVQLSAIAFMRGSVNVSGVYSREEAEEVALETANNGDVEWTYDGLTDQAIEIIY